MRRYSARWLSSGPSSADVDRAATVSYRPLHGATQEIASVGSPQDPQIVIVHGDCQVSSATGYGILLVRGTLELRSRFAWYGVILVIGEGDLQWGHGNGHIAGAVFIARTRQEDRSPMNPLGTARSALGPVRVAFRGGGDGIAFDSDWIARAERTLPYRAVAYRAY